MKELFQAGDWAKEKHVPSIEVIEADHEKGITARVSIGREIAHPNTSAHHIAWISVFFLPEGGKFPWQVARFEFSAHGASVKGPDTSGAYTAPEATFVFRAETGGKLLAASYCNIHGLWEGESEVTL